MARNSFSGAIDGRPIREYNAEKSPADQGAWPFLAHDWGRTAPRRMSELDALKAVASETLH
jgi:hypothetical protein